MDITINYNDNKIKIFKIYSGTIHEIVMMHSHTKTGYELHLIDSGKGFLDTESERYELGENSLYITGPNVLHKQTPDPANPMHELCIYFKISSLKNNNKTLNAFASKNFWIGECSQEVRNLFEQMVEENDKNDSWKKDALSALALRLIVEICRLYFPNSETETAQPKGTDLNESRSWILDQLLLEDCSDVTLSDFAKKMGVSERHAERIIKDYYGASFKKLRYESKMAMAATMLEQNNISVEECAIKCGYTCSAAFITAFKSKYKITPKAYKNKFRQKKS